MVGVRRSFAFFWLSVGGVHTCSSLRLTSIASLGYVSSDFAGHLDIYSSHDFAPMVEQDVVDVDCGDCVVITQKPIISRIPAECYIMSSDGIGV